MDTATYLFKIGLGSVGPAGRIRPSDKIVPAREYMIRPAKLFQNLYEMRPANVNITKFVQNFFRTIFIKQKCKTLTLKTFVKLDFYFCGDKNTLLLKYLFLFRVSWSNPFSNYPKEIFCWTNFDDLTFLWS